MASHTVARLIESLITHAERKGRKARHAEIMWAEVQPDAARASEIAMHEEEEVIAKRADQLTVIIDAKDETIAELLAEIAELKGSVEANDDPTDERVATAFAAMALDGVDPFFLKLGEPQTIDTHDRGQ